MIKTYVHEWALTSFQTQSACSQVILLALSGAGEHSLRIA